MDKVISRKNLPARIPVFPTIALYLLLDNLQAPGYVWGICFTVMGLLIVAALVLIAKEKEVDVIGSLEAKK